MKGRKIVARGPILTKRIIDNRLSSAPSGRVICVDAFQGLKPLAESYYPFGISLRFNPDETVPNGRPVFCREAAIQTSPGLEPWAWSLALRRSKQRHRIERSEDLAGVFWVCGHRG